MRILKKNTREIQFFKIQNKYPTFYLTIYRKKINREDILNTKTNLGKYIFKIKQ